MSCLISGFGIHQTKIIKCQQVKSVGIEPKILYTQPCGQARRQIVTNLKLLQTDVVCISEEECIGIGNPVLLLPLKRSRAGCIGIRIGPHTCGITRIGPPSFISKLLKIVSKVTRLCTDILNRSCSSLDQSGKIERFVGHPDTHAAIPFVSPGLDRKSTRLNSSHVAISYAVFCLKKKNYI